MGNRDKTPLERYNERSKRIGDAVQLKVPDRIPISIEDEGVFVKHGGTNWAEVMYDFQKATDGTKKLWLDLDLICRRSDADRLHALLRNAVSDVICAVILNHLTDLYAK